MQFCSVYKLIYLAFFKKAIKIFVCPKCISSVLIAHPINKKVSKVG